MESKEFEKDFLRAIIKSDIMLLSGLFRRIFLKKLVFILFFCFCLLQTAHPIGLGFSFFLPSDGIPGVETAVNGNFTIIEDYLKVPISLVYQKVYGIKVSGISTARQAWVYGDIAQLYLNLEFTLPLGNFHFTAYGGAVADLHLHLDLLDGAVDRDLAANYNYDLVNSDLSVSSKPGIGYQAGFGFGFRIERITLELTFGYLDTYAVIDINGSYSYYDGGSVQQAGFSSGENARLRLNGYRIGFSVDYAL